MARRKHPNSDPPPTGDRSPTDSADSDAYFVCATNRPCTGIDEQLLEDLMHDNNCAAMWEYPEDSDRTRVQYVAHMQRVKAGDLIFMFASGGVGIIGVGRAIAGCPEPRLPNHHQRLRPDWPGEEWRVPVEWIRWQPNEPCPFQSYNATFYEVTGPSETWDVRREAVLEFFNLE